MFTLAEPRAAAPTEAPPATTPAEPAAWAQKIPGSQAKSHGGQQANDVERQARNPPMGHQMPEYLSQETYQQAPDGRGTGHGENFQKPLFEVAARY
jgi:hypothetical protein